MSWNLERSQDRVRHKWEETAGVEVTRLTKQMDLTNITLMRPKLVHAAHLYVDIENFAELLGSELDEPTAKEILRRLHLQAREITRICETDFDAAKVHFQGPKLHAIVYRPYDDHGALVQEALLLVAAIRHSVEVIANDVLGGDWTVAAGIDIGDAVATMNGVGGDRELLFLGNPANRAAKIITRGISITDESAELVADKFDGYLSDGAPGTKVFSMGEADLVEALVGSPSTWTASTSEKRLADELEKWPINRVKISRATGEIDKSCLGLANNKLVSGANVFVDIDGFTAYIDAAADVDGELVHAVRSFHVIRSEMRAVAVNDYGALRVQYQGDRMQALAFMPMDDAKIARKGIDIGAGINASVVHTLPSVVGSGALPVATGVCLGETIVTRVGEHGQRDQVCLGSTTQDAARIEEGLDGGDIGIDKTSLELLPEELAAEFNWSPTAGCYVAAELTSDRIERLVDGAMIDSAAGGSLLPAPPIRTEHETSGRPYHP